MTFIKNNWLSIVSLLIGLMGIYLAFYFYEESQISREPAFINNESTELFTSNSIGTQNFTIINNKTGEPVKSKIFTQDLTLWNEGKNSIRRENILRPLEVTYSNQVEILEATITESSRHEITNPNATTSKNKNSILIDFDILEQDDGIKIRVIYSSKKPENPEILGAIESVKKIKSNKDLQSKNILYGAAETAKTIFTALLTIALIVLISAIPDIVKRVAPELLEKIPKTLKKAASLLIPSAIFIFITIGGGIIFYKSTLKHAQEETLSNIPTMTPVKKIE